MQPHTVLLTISGMSGSGKSFFADAIARHYPPGKTVVIHMDNYYKRPDDIIAGNFDFDDPSAFFCTELIHDLRSLFLYEQPIEERLYSFNKPAIFTGRMLYPARIVICEGLYPLLITHNEVNLWNNKHSLSVYLDTPISICTARRIVRDAKHRQISPRQNMEQIISTVSKHEPLVQSQARYADLVFPAINTRSIEQIIILLDGLQKT